MIKSVRVIVASAAPAMPMWKTKMNSGSRIVLTIAPIRLHSMENFGLPSARIRLEPPIVMIRNGNSDGGNSGVSTGVINDIRRCTKEKHHRTQKKLNGNAEDHTEDCQHGDGISNIGFRVLRILSAHAEIEICSTADAAEQTDGCADHAEWERYVGRCVSEHAVL